MTEKLISFPVTRHDRNFARLWLGALSLIFVFGLFAEDFSFFGLVICALMLGFGIEYFNKTVWSVVAEVWDCGSYLKVVSPNKQQKINFEEISEIELTYSNLLHLITIKSKVSGSFGKVITFRATSGYPWFRRPKLLSELQKRMKNA
jgi:hypothetical protein